MDPRQANLSQRLTLDQVPELTNPLPLGPSWNADLVSVAVGHVHVCGEVKQMGSILDLWGEAGFWKESTSITNVHKLNAVQSFQVPRHADISLHTDLKRSDLAVIFNNSFIHVF